MLAGLAASSGTSIFPKSGCAPTTASSDSNAPRAMIILPIDLVSFIVNSLSSLFCPLGAVLFFELRSLSPGYPFALVLRYERFERIYPTPGSAVGQVDAEL